ncbi:putative aconitase, subunit [Aeropyrum pernix]|uniref:Phosphomevalonate dehydratase large subunit n=1 Tax=Aeropyrum pernix TaxID=56636 RepID=A0A401H7U5_AERPX|nr:putative aconitase, subunit [Aeropyrum pernix]
MGWCVLYLTREEERILAGEEGEARAKALEVIVKVGEAVGAERLIPIKHAHVSGASYMTIGDAGLRFLARLAESGAMFSVPTTVNPVSYDVEEPGAIPMVRLSPRIVKAQGEILRALEAMGADLILTCTPYYTEVPRRVGLREGDSVAWGESSAVAYANSVLGIHTNREGGPLALMAGIAGRTYFYGAHDPEWRKPRVAYRLETPKVLDETEAGVLGEVIATQHRDEHPPLLDAPLGGEAALKELSAAVGSAGSLAMVHITGVTPGDPGDMIEEFVTMDYGDLARRMEDLAPGFEPDILYVGCPHASIEELRRLYRALSKAGERAGGRTVVSISRSLYLQALREGLVEKLKGLGVRFVRDSCLIVSPFSGSARGVRVATNSYKAYFYLSKKGVEVGLAPIEALPKLVS